ncbi:unnamed protein product, partial [Didymodactylos carnosus]
NKFLSGTDANVKIRFYDEKDQESEEFHLSHEKSKMKKKDLFERNQLDQFHVGTMKDLSDLKRIEILHDAEKNSGWYCDYVEIVDRQTNKTYCFPCDHWLDGDDANGLTRIELVYDKNIDCKQLKSNDVLQIYDSKNKTLTAYTIQTKTNPNSDHLTDDGIVYVKLFDNEKSTEDIPLKYSELHKKPFEKGNIDKFHVSSEFLMHQIKKLSIWHDFHKSINFDWIEVKNNRTRDINCFPLNTPLLSRKNSLTNRRECTHYYTKSCEVENDMKINKVVNDILLPEHIHTVSKPATSPHENYRTKYRVRVKTGKAKDLFRTGGKDIQVYLKIFDDKEATEDDIFYVSTEYKMNNIVKAELFYTGRKNNGWYIEWLEIVNEETSQFYCYLINRWLNLNNKDGGIRIELTNPSSRPCEDSPLLRKSVKQSLESNNLSLYESHFQVKIKKGSKGILGLLGDKTPPYVYLRITDENDQKSENILLKYPRRDDKHGKSFHSGYINIYDNIGSQKCLGNIKKLELWHDSRDKEYMWFCDWLEMYDFRHGRYYCYRVQKKLDYKVGTEQNPIELIHYSDTACSSGRSSKPTLLSNYNEKSKYVTASSGTDNQTQIPSHSLPTHIFDKNQQQQTSIHSTYQNQDSPVYATKYHIKTKTGAHSFFHTSDDTTKDAIVYLRVYDTRTESEPIFLKNSLENKHPFQEGYEDYFEVGTEKEIGDLHKVDLWIDDDKKWFCDYVQITDKKTDRLYCFPCHRWLNKDENSTLVQLQTYYDKPCDGVMKEVELKPHNQKLFTASQIPTSDARTSTDYSANFIRHYKVRVKTGKHDNKRKGQDKDLNVYIKLFDGTQSSEDIHLKSSALSTDSRKHYWPFEKNNIDTFHVSSVTKLDNLVKLIVYHDSSDDNDGLYIDWIEMIDLDRDNKVYCFPINAWLDVKEANGKTRRESNDYYSVPCKDLDMKNIEKENQRNREKSVRTGDIIRAEFTDRFEIRTKTGDKSFMSETEIDGDIYIQLHDINGQSSDNIHLKRSQNHKNKSEHDHIDIFKVNTSSANHLSTIESIEIKINGKDQSWFCKSIEILDRKTGKIYCFYVNKWLSVSEGEKKIVYYFDSYSTKSCVEEEEELIKSNKLNK